MTGNAAAADTVLLAASTGSCDGATAEALGIVSDLTALTLGASVTVTAAVDTSVDSLSFPSGFCGVFWRLIT